MDIYYDAKTEILATNNFFHRVKRDAKAREYATTTVAQAVCGTSVYIYNNLDWRTQPPQTELQQNKRPCSKCFKKLSGAYNYIPG